MASLPSLILVQITAVMMLTERTLGSTKDLLAGPAACERLYCLQSMDGALKTIAEAGTSAYRAQLYPNHARPAEELAELLQAWLRDELQAQVDPLHSRCKEAVAVSTFTVTADDVVAAAENRDMHLSATQDAYRAICMIRHGLRVSAPNTLFGWCEPPTSEGTGCFEVYDAGTMAEMLCDEHQCGASPEDVAHAAAGLACINSGPQEFFEATMRSRGTRIISVRNPAPGQNPAAELFRDAPRYKWEVAPAPLDPPDDPPPGLGTSGVKMIDEVSRCPAEGDARLPWDEILPAHDFARELNHLFATKSLAPALGYFETPTLPFPAEFDPRCVDADLVRRLAEGEWHAPLDNAWGGLRIVKVPTYRWELEFMPPVSESGMASADTASDISPHMPLPDPLQAYTLKAMAEDAAGMLHSPFAPEDVEAVANNRVPPGPGAAAAFLAYSRRLARAHFIVTIRRCGHIEP